MQITKLNKMKFKVEYDGKVCYARFKVVENGEFLAVQLYDYEWFGKQINKDCIHIGHRLVGRNNLIEDAVRKYEEVLV